jgi:uncharacterized protein (DUF4415 family)
LPDRIEDGEERWHAAGIVGSVALLLIVHADPNPQDEDRILIMRKAVSHAQLNQLAKIAALPDGQIDTVDVAEAPVENPGQGRRPVKRSVTIRLDSDVIAWFKEHAANGRYQTEINRVLRQHVTAAEKQRT